MTRESGTPADDATLYYGQPVNLDTANFDGRPTAPIRDLAQSDPVPQPTYGWPSAWPLAEPHAQTKAVGTVAPLVSIRPPGPRHQNRRR